MLQEPLAHTSFALSSLAGDPLDVRAVGSNDIGSANGAASPANHSLVLLSMTTLLIEDESRGIRNWRST
jgi:hypothetical protein